MPLRSGSRMAGAAALLVVVGATRGWWLCYFVAWVCLLRRPATTATKDGGATATATIGVGVCYEGRRRLLQWAAARQRLLQ